MPTTVDSIMGLILPKLLILPVPVGLNMAKDIDPVIVTNPGTYLYIVSSFTFWTHSLVFDRSKIDFKFGLKGEMATFCRT